MPSLLQVFSIVSTEVLKIAAAFSGVAEVAAIPISCRSSFKVKRPILRFFQLPPAGDSAAIRRCTGQFGCTLRGARTVRAAGLRRHSRQAAAISSAGLGCRPELLARSSLFAFVVNEATLVNIIQIRGNMPVCSYTVGVTPRPYLPCRHHERQS